MKCPKCGYLGFEDADRCRNCGYDFSLSAPANVPELPLRIEEPEHPIADDLVLSEGPRSNRADASTEAAPRPASPELPLLFEAEPDDEPLIKHPSVPRPPLAVRRATPEVPRLRSDQGRVLSSDVSSDVSSDASSDLAPAEAVPRAPRRGQQAAHEPRVEAPQHEAAGIFARFVAVAIDVIILAAIDALVIYFTLQICNLTVADLALLPRGPLIAFLLVQNGGYLVVFTAGGQTLGKMAAGIRVVPAEPDTTLDVGQAFVRELLWVALAVPAGLGFVSALFSRDRRGLHDRLAGTRVVR